MLRLPGVAADGRVLHTGTPDGSGSGLDLLRQFALAKQQQARVEFGASRCRCNRTPHVGRQSSTPAIVGCRAALRSPWEKQAVQLTVRSIGPLPRPRSAPHPSNVCPPPPGNPANPEPTNSTSTLGGFVLRAPDVSQTESLCIFDFAVARKNENPGAVVSPRSLTRELRQDKGVNRLVNSNPFHLGGSPFDAKPLAAAFQEARHRFGRRKFSAVSHLRLPQSLPLSRLPTSDCKLAGDQIAPTPLITESWSSTTQSERSAVAGMANRWTDVGP